MKRRPRRSPRPSPPPPAILHGPGEVLEGAGILEEFPEPLGTVLWLALRDVRLWADAPPSARAGLFAEGALQRRMAMLWEVQAGPEPSALLTALSALVGDPAGRQPAEVSASCRLVAQWAERREAPGAALAFAQAAALADPGHAPAALYTGELALRRGEEARAESWLRRAVVLARRAGDARTGARAQLGLARLHARRGAWLPAFRACLFAVRRARRKHLRDVWKAALEELVELARGTQVGGRAHLLVLVAREAAYARDRESFDWAWTAAREVLEQAEGAAPARALLALARAAAAAGAWQRAEDAGQRALEAAVRQEDGEARAEVEEFHSGLRARTGRMHRTGRPPRGPGAQE